MGKQSEELAERFEKVNAALAGLIEGASPAQWSTRCEGEGWTVGVTSHHVAVGAEQIAALVQAVATGQAVPAITFDALDQGNAEHARTYAGCTKEETLDLLRQNAGAASKVVEGLSDDQLAASATVIAGGPPMTARQVIENVLIGHAAGHLTSIQRVL